VVLIKGSEINGNNVCEDDLFLHQIIILITLQIADQWLASKSLCDLCVCLPAYRKTFAPFAVKKLNRKGRKVKNTENAKRMSVHFSNFIYVFGIRLFFVFLQSIIKK
jgi:hypothetical protein